MPRDEWNAENFAYRILYRRKEEGGDWKSITVEDPFADKYTIDLGDGGARAWDQYEVCFGIIICFLDINFVKNSYC